MEFAQVNHFLEIYRIGDYAGLLGLIISFVGFFFTIKVARNSRTAAQEATSAVEGMRGDLRREDTVADFSSALAIMDEIKRMQRSPNLHLLPDRYSQLRKLLVSIRSANPLLTEIDQLSLQSAIVQFSALERYVERALEGSAAISPAKMNSLVSKQIEALLDVLVRIKSEIEIGDKA